MLDMHFFRNPAFSVGVGGMILVFLAMYGWMFLTTQYFQQVLGYTPARRPRCAVPARAVILADRPEHAAADRPLRRRTASSPRGCCSSPRRCARSASSTSTARYWQIMAGFFPMAAGMALACRR